MRSKAAFCTTCWMRDFGLYVYVRFLLFFVCLTHKCESQRASRMSDHVSQFNQLTRKNMCQVMSEYENACCTQTSALVRIYVAWHLTTCEKMRQQTVCTVLYISYLLIYVLIQLPVREHVCTIPNVSLNFTEHMPFMIVYMSKSYLVYQTKSDSEYIATSVYMYIYVYIYIIYIICNTWPSLSAGLIPSRWNQYVTSEHA